MSKYRRRYNFTELIGKKFGRLTVLSEGDRKVYKCNQVKRTAICLCDCGNTKTISVHEFFNGKTISCGCIAIQNTIDMAKGNIKHGLTETSEYEIWCGVKKRCCSKKDQAYNRYGGRGIKICERWLNSFQNFINDMGERPSQKHSIERIDNNGDYSPENCRWATAKEQSRNTRRNNYIIYGDKELCLSEWAEIKGLNVGTLWGRIFKLKWDVDRAINTPTIIKYKNKWQTIL